MSSLRGVVFTHRHADHADAFANLPDSIKSYVGKEDWPTHLGALPCRWPSARTPTIVEFASERFGAFEQSFSLTADRRLRIVPLPGHSPGHLGAMLALGEQRFVLFAGDSSFSMTQVNDGTIAGISEVPSQARQSLRQTKAQLAIWPTFLLPSHDRQSVGRFLADEISRAF
jgi:N-acyl homoserine lactone hydrolase